MQNQSGWLALEKLRAYVEARDFSGYDPYDALNSPLIRAATFGWKPARIAAIQILRRLPFNPRPLLGIRPGHNPKALGLFLEGYVRLQRAHPEQDYLPRIQRLLDLLAATQIRTASGGAGWGYNFDWQSRAFFVPKFTPTGVNTAFIGHALLDAWEQLGLERARALAQPARDFILRDLNRIPEDDAFCFSYTALDRYAVHNASLLAASLLFRLSQLAPDAEGAAAAQSALRYSLRHQHADGSWFYAEREGSRWVDSFHTGFNLEAIRRFRTANHADAGPQAAFERGVEYYAGRFFLPDGTPKYYADQIYPLDIHAPAEAVCFFAGEGGAHADLTARVAAWMLEHMADPAGYFYFRRGKRHVNRVPYMRWSQAWAFRALAAYVTRPATGSPA